MPKVTVRKCPFTKALFESNTDYVKHLASLRKEFKAKRKHMKVVRNLSATFVKMRATCVNAADIEQFIKDNWESFCANDRVNDHWHDTRGKNLKFPKLVKVAISFKWGSGQYEDRDLISNTHNAPVTGKWKGKTNWGGKVKGVPRGYPGWTGQIEYTLDKTGRCFDFGSSAFKNTGICTGSGGGGDSQRYSIELYADDWPAMFNAHSQRVFKEKLGFACDEMV